MYLKSLEIQGFKSFPDKTVIHFGSDITAIVGPNGSGKSNISDAISWVMGEQSSKALRGSKMEDVIFGGTLKRPQVGFAEASLILDNSDGALRIETAEVMVTRRYYRSGDSEYYINKQTARLRDINELFMDTGLGKEGYSNIGQGRIDEILSIKSTDRREVFEEAAGISKFRHRKEETERRLANTQENLIRVGDKISELELQVTPLREQAEKAQKYLALRGELKNLEVTVWLDSLEKLAIAAKKAEEDYNSAAFILEQAHDSLNQLYHSAEQLGFELHNRDLQIDQIRESITKLEGQIRDQDGEIAVLQTNVENNNQNIARAAGELKDQQDRSGGIQGQIAQLQKRVEVLSKQQEDVLNKLPEIQKESERICQSLEETLNKLTQLQSQQTGAEAAYAGKQTELSALQMTLEEQASRRKILAENQLEAQEKLNRTLEDQKAAEKLMSEAEEAVISAQNTIAGYQLRMKTRAAKRDELQKSVSAVGIELDTVLSKIRMFQEMEREYDGYSKAVRIVMQEAGRGSLPNIYGPVSKLLKTDDDYTVAIETALGAAMQYIVVQAEEDGKAAIQLLKRRDAGRATFFPVRTITGRTLQEKGLEALPGYVGVASELISYDARFHAIFQNLLGRIVIVENLDQAIVMARKFGNRFRIVTLDGQVINAGGSMTGGSSSKNAGILSRANELQRLRQLQENLDSRKVQLEKELSEASRAAAEVEFQLSAVQGQLRQAEDTVLRMDGICKQRVLQVEAAQRQVDSVLEELDAVDGKAANSDVRRKQLSDEIMQLEQTVNTLEKQTATLQVKKEELQSQNGAIQEQITELKMAAAAYDAEQSAAQDSLAQLCSLEEALRGDRSVKEQLMRRYEDENSHLHQKIEELKTSKSASQQSADQIKLELQTAISERGSIEARKTRAEKEAQDKNKDILLMERESARLEQRKTTTALEERQIIDKLWDTYELTPTTAVSEKVPVESTAAANKEIVSLKRKISALGTPNLGAIEEFSRVNERYEYLSAQRDDVLHSKEELEEIIKSITAEMTEIFVHEFARINEYFSQTFLEMFGGGKASLELDDPEDPLSCGIEIRVQPPGKQLKTITLLSGGEKAFVAIALYFAILRVRPTPFCLLDEIDAALDDNNVRRFASYLRNLCDKTQFIVITHRRGTMEEADVLYGVTMQEQGISKILHIDLGQMEQQMGIKS